MDRFRIPRKNGLGEDVLDLRPVNANIEILKEQVAALAARVQELEARLETVESSS